MTFIRVLHFSPVSNSTNAPHSLPSQNCPCQDEAWPGKPQISTALLDIGEHRTDMYLHVVCYCFVGDSSYNRTDIKETYFLLRLNCKEHQQPRSWQSPSTSTLKLMQQFTPRSKNLQTIYQTLWCHIPDKRKLNIQSRANLKSQYEPKQNSLDDSS
jgi:hypothetical protein